MVELFIVSFSLRQRQEQVGSRKSFFLFFLRLLANRANLPFYQSQTLRDLIMYTRKKLTKLQQRAILYYYRRNPDGASSYLEFRKRWNFILFGGDAVGGYWLGMFIGIEVDGIGNS